MATETPSLPSCPGVVIPICQVVGQCLPPLFRQKDTRHFLNSAILCPNKPGCRHFFLAGNFWPGRLFNASADK